MPRAFSRATISRSPAGTGGIDAAQHVVGAEFEDDAVGAVGDRPVEPFEPARCGVAGDARIDDLDLVTFAYKRPLQGGRKGGALGQAVAGSEAIAEDDEVKGARLCRTRQGRENGEARREK